MGRKLIDLTGQRFGNWTVIKKTKKDKHNNTKFLCKCDCGKLKEVNAESLKRGLSTSCGCFINRKRTDIIGQKFGKLTVIKRLPSNKHNHAMWLCQCDCGNTRCVSQNSLKSGNTRSCGCLQKEMTKKFFEKKRKKAIPKGIRNTLYRMKNRCYNPNATKYKYYGGRGIKICDEWLNKENGMKSFYNWAIQNGYKEGLTIDRIDVNGNYEPNNCRWATIKEQANNKRDTRFLNYNNETYSISEWAEILKIPAKTLRNRIDRHWDIERAFTQRIGTQRQVKQFDKNNNFIRQYNTITQAQRETNIIAIGCCCKGKLKTAGGYVWRYADENNNKFSDNSGESEQGN